MQKSEEPLRTRARVHRILTLCAVGATFLVPLSCSPLGSTANSGTVELHADAGLPDGSTPPPGVHDPAVGTPQVLGTSIERGDALAAPATATTAPPATVAPAPPATERAPAPAPSPAPTTGAPASTEPPPESAPVLTPAGPAAARATEGLSSPAAREIASQALGSIVYDWRNSLPGWEIRFLDSRPGYRGITYPDERVIEVYLRDNDTARSLAHVVAHELGHAVDVTWFSAADRAAWMSVRRVDASTTWFVSNAQSDFRSGAGDFAESFAWWQIGPPTWFGELAPPPTDAQLVALAGLVLHP